MTQPYSNDLRERVRAHLGGEPIRHVAARGVSVSSVPKWVARYRATGSVAPGKVGDRPWLLEPHRELVHNARRRI